MSALPANLSKPAQRALSAAGITCVEDLAKFTEMEIAALHGMGPNAMRKLTEAMSVLNIYFKNS